MPRQEGQAPEPAHRIHVLNRAGKTLEAVANDTDRDHFMSAEEAKAWGIVDKVL